MFIVHATLKYNWWLLVSGASKWKVRPTGVITQYYWTKTDPQQNGTQYILWMMYVLCLYTRQRGTYTSGKELKEIAKAVEKDPE